MNYIKNDKILKISYMISGLYDFSLGIGVLFFSDLLIQIFSVAKPDPAGMIYVHLSGLFLLIFAYFLIYSSRDIPRMAFIGFGIAFLRLSFAFLIFSIWLNQGIALGYIIIALADTIMASSLLGPLLLTEGITWKYLWIIKR